MFKSMLMVCAVLLTCAAAAGAADVGRLTLVEDRAELLKEGNLPAIAVKVNDAVGSRRCSSHQVYIPGSDYLYRQFHSDYLS